MMEHVKTGVGVVLLVLLVAYVVSVVVQSA